MLFLFGKISIENAAEKFTKPSVCRIFNTSRTKIYLVNYLKRRLNNFMYHLKIRICILNICLFDPPISNYHIKY